jgi:hypothetical protein
MKFVAQVWRRMCAEKVRMPASLAQAGEELGEAVDVERLAGAGGEEWRLGVRGDA